MPLLTYCLRRLLEALLLLFGLVTLVFFLSRLLPGDAASVFISPGVSPAVIDQLRQQFGLDRPPLEQFVCWLGAAARGEFGYSFAHHAPVAEVLAEVFPNTVVLGGAALILEIVLAIAVAFLVARSPGSWIDRGLSQASLVAYALPTFWIGILLLTMFSYSLGIFPSSQMHSMAAGEGGGIPRALDLLHHLALPVVTVAIPGAAGMARYLRASITTAQRQDYVLMARSMGFSRSKVFLSYVLPNSVGPLISIVGMEFGGLLTGVLVTETIFSWPGMGRLAIMAIFARDYPLILGCTVVSGVVVLVGNTLADLLNAWIDPRVRVAGRDI